MKNMSKTFEILAGALMVLGLASCQEDYMEEQVDVPTDKIEFEGIVASKDSACMYDTIVLHARAKGEHLDYQWQRAKGTLVVAKDDPSKAYFWGCTTCLGTLTIYCTVANSYGAYTKEVKVFIFPWRTDQEPWDGWEKFIEQMEGRQ